MVDKGKQMIDLEKLAGSGGRRRLQEYLENTVWNAVSGADTLDDVLNSPLGDLFERALPKKTAASFRAIVTRMREYTYNPGAYRRSYRSRDPKDYYRKLVSLAYEVQFDWEKFDLTAFLTMDDESKKKEAYKSPNTWTTSMLIALKIDQGEKDIINAVTDIILSENNTRIVSYELMRAVAMCHNAKLHELMKKLLIAAKLQEGLRQAILETADDGVLDYFKLMIKTVLENNLLRFSSALRAAGVWMGLGYDYSDRRVVEKLLKLGYAYIEDDSSRAGAVDSRDTAQMYAGMWAESVFSIQNLRAHAERFMRGEKHQKLAAFYFLNETGSYESRISLAGEALGETDMDTLTLILQNYTLTLNGVTEGLWNPKDSEKNIDRDKYPHCLKDKSTRERHFSRLSEIIEKIPKDGHTIRGKPFDWCVFTLTRGAVFTAMMTLAAYDYDKALQQRLIELSHLAEPENKSDFLIYFVSRDVSGEKKAFLFDCLSDKSMAVRKHAAKLLKQLTPDESEIIKVEELLGLKTGEIRQSALVVIRNSGSAVVLSSAKRLIADKNDNKRLAALDLLCAAKKSGAITTDTVREICAAIQKATEAEAILLNGLLDKNAPEYTKENGFGLYDPEYFPELPPVERDGKFDLKAFRKISAKDMMKVFESLLALIEEHKEHEYKVVYAYGDGNDNILGNANYLGAINVVNDRPVQIEDYVLGEIWRGWFEKNRANLLTLFKIACCESIRDYELYRQNYKPFARDLMKKLLGSDEIKEFIKKRNTKKYYMLADNIIHLLLSFTAEYAEIFAVSYGILADLFLSSPKEDWSEPCFEEDNNYNYSAKHTLANLSETQFFLIHLRAQTRVEYEKKLSLCYAIGGASDSRYIAFNAHGLLDIAYAAANGIVEKGELRRAFMEINGTVNMTDYTRLYLYAKKTTAKYPVLLECVNDVVKRVIEIELKRGDTKTPVSELARAISRHEGAEVFARILIALGNETLTRGYVWSMDYTKRDVLSSLLKASVPAKDDNAETLRSALRERVCEKRLLEAAMYAPAWISIMEDYLGWAGLKCGAWYFHAHTRESYSDEFETEAARFSPIDKKDFRRGAFDINWFREAYQTLGAERFALLYDCAKYISGGAAHRRAQLFADAVLGKLSIDDTEKQIRDKRNKDLLLSYSLIPFGENKTREALRRFEFLNEFQKKSREFGVQRQAAEKEAANIALENLARNLGYADVLRFNWKMEMEKLGAIQDYFKPRNIDGVALFLEMNDTGLAELIVEKDGKRLKSIPAAIKKNEYVQEISAVKNSLKAQFSRTRVSLEKAMENSDTFSFEEASWLLDHPVIRPIAEKLVFKSGDELGFLTADGLLQANGAVIAHNKDAALKIAHCYDLFILGKWLDYQRYAFDRNLVQPFKQIFRELYTVNDDEKSEKTVSRRYAGHQIQPKKTAALLKSRGWTADYENGLQKVYYKENVIAAMYALADWFSPSEIEAPTLETVRFYGRKTGLLLELESLNPILFSEVMRDIDLVVSAAHTGGVDPETSHSTVQMRAVIVTESVRLMKLSNVTISGRYAKILGERGEYSVHLGSGQAHMMGRGALNILPVHSQHRGRLFLPFMDEDPKTAEIVSKVLLLAQDTKIKDPAIMAQIVSAS